MVGVRPSFSVILHQQRRPGREAPGGLGASQWLQRKRAQHGLASSLRGLWFTARFLASAVSTCVSSRWHRMQSPSRRRSWVPSAAPGRQPYRPPQASARSHRMRRGCPDRKSPKDEACVCYGAGAGSWRCWAPPQLRPGTPSGGLLGVLQPCVGSSTHPTNTVRYSLQASQS